MRFHMFSVDHKSLSLRGPNTRNMERHALQIVLLAFLLAAAVPCAASEASGSEPEPDFTVTISKEGITENSQREFSLGPSATLRVVDETGKATLLPAPSAAAEGEAGQYSVAYVFENGQCNFEKTVAYKDAFPGYSQQLWVRTGTEAGTEEVVAGEVGNYTFTNPPDEYLSGGGSFCVRFTTSQSTTTTTTPTTTDTQATKTNASTSAVGSPPGSESSGESSTAQSPEASHGGSQGSQNHEEEAEGASAEEKVRSAAEAFYYHHGEDRGDAPITVENVDVPVAKQPSPTPKQEESAQTPSQSSSPGELPAQDLAAQDVKTTASSTSASRAAPSATEEQETVNSPAVGTILPPSTLVDTPDNKGTDGDVHSRLRRLSDSDVSEVKYLTIVVHSDADCSTAGTLTLSAALLALTASILSSF
ncbi:unnamed protein product [Neospora caninum Liverpool]|uniref:Toxoplasma gondii family A protein n=1 Tax=Neospora caninum (strain Liverpool) TaxID=572307 RepID=F0VE54_NEOCL|nr:uncharacterized protein NCLIV_017890 [Neospora caninum Liverpool]CBZ51997.1 unnamed protein product [Neospora caninum Liverpool]CEL65958.1 TPA: hypothetical protein BN1204_017890 [Neospora caninum Liverpool]|eukprot:XP_003882030.1 uncharacterized protein NCLIV_017890 [Neospora caninum Liverpool]